MDQVEYRRDRAHASQSALLPRLILALCLPLALAATSVQWMSGSQWFYTTGFRRHHVIHRTGMDEEQLSRIASSLIAYFRSGSKFVDIADDLGEEADSLFTEEERLHLRDVKNLLAMNAHALLILAVILFGAVGCSLLRRGVRSLAGALLAGAATTATVCAVLGTYALLDFDGFFTTFHLLAFSNDLWAADGYMHYLFPAGFWCDALLLVLASSGAIALVLGTAAFTARRLMKEGD